MSTPFPIGPTGIWNCADLQHYPTDESLIKALVGFMKGRAWNVVDIGCGSGNYVNALREHGIPAYGIDGNPNSKNWCYHIECLDLTKPVYRSAYHWGLCLETGEHIPSEFESALLENIDRLCSMGVVMSWFPVDGHGIGHVNPRSNEWVETEMQKRGFKLDEEASRQLREAAVMWWYKKSLQVYRRT